MKKRLIIISTLSISCMLSGCHISHEWQDATCTTPKTCSVCGKTEGEALGHTWVDATCSEAKHCSVCGETDGNPLEHTLTKANYQQPSICEVCGETVGEPLQADFEKRGIKYDAELDTTYSYVAPCRDAPDIMTEGTAFFSDYEVFESDETHEALEGYEWRAITLTINFDDENAQNYGCTRNWFANSYYETEREGFYNDKTNAITVNYNGIDYTDGKIDEKNIFNGWEGGICKYETRLFFRLPEGYDGIVVGIYNPANAGEDKSIFDMIDNQSIIFRLQ